MSNRSQNMRRPGWSPLAGDAAGRPYPSSHLAALGLAGPPPALSCDGIEVTQVVQDMAHDVPLIAGKVTAVRVYLGVQSPEFVELRGTLAARSPAGQGVWQSIPSIGTVALDPADNGALRKKREDLAKSLNFLLPADVTRAGACEVRLDALELADGSQSLGVPGGAARNVEFVESPPLRVHMVGIRYGSAGADKTYEPRPLDFTLIRSWLQRAYPVAAVEWSQINIDSPRQWPFAAPDINSFLRGLRKRELLGGVDRRTHYFGLVSDGGGGNFMRGQASGVPKTADSSTVASGPTGTFDFNWDSDGSYGDWYTAHELGHTFGRFHAEFCSAQDGAPYPFENGQLSDDDGKFVGFDIGDAAQGLPMRALPGVAWHDVMTYCNNQWLSSFTFTGIHQRLLDEDHQAAGAAGPAGPQGLFAMTPGGSIHVIATVNLTTATGRLQYVTAYPEVSPEAGVDEGDDGLGGAAPAAFSLRLSNSSGKPLAEYPAHVIPDVCREPGEDKTGIIDATIPDDTAATTLELLLNGNRLDIFTSSAPAMPASEIRAMDRGPARLVGGETAAPVLTWFDPGRQSQVGPQALAALSGQASTYTVELSVDGGKTWRTVGFGLAEPQVTIDPTLLVGVTTVQVKVTTTDGFSSKSSVATLRAADIIQN